MRNFQNVKTARWFYSFPILIVIFLGIIFLGQSSLKAYSRARGARAVYIEVSGDYEKLALKRTDLEKRLAYLSTPYGLEKELRRQFGLAKDGEGLITIIDRHLQAASDDNGGLGSFFSKMGNFLKGLFNVGP